MKNYLILAAFVLLNTAAFGQVLPKGTLVGMHTFSVKLNGKTTMQQFEDAVKAKWVPASSKAFSCQSHVLKFVRGKSANKMGVLIIYKNDAERNKFYNPDDLDEINLENLKKEVSINCNYHNKYNQVDKKIKDSINVFFRDVFDLEKPFTQSDLDMILNIYRSLDKNLVL